MSVLEYNWNDEPTVAESFDDMRSHLLAMGAGERALSGMVDTEDEGKFAAVYRVTNEPPQVMQIQLTGHANVTANLRIIGVNEQGDPTLAQGRYTYNLPADADAIYAAVSEGTPLLQAGNNAAGVFFDQIHEQTFSFEPDQPTIAE
jgi:hypothetical protein